MKRMNKLVALLLATVMVLGLMPAMHVHADEYPTLALDKPTAVEITEGGQIAYFTFTPEVTDQYAFYSSNDVGTYADTYGHLYDAEMNELTTNDDAYYGNPLDISSPNFCIDYVMEAGKTYILAARLYSSGTTGSFYVTLTNVHSYVSTVTKEHTCTEDGVLTWACEHCGASYDEPIPAAHSWGEDGVCTVCGETYLITGVCGDNLTWTLDWFGTMTISGTGDMYDYFYSWDSDTPSEWYEQYNYNITSVTVEEGCTSIGDYAFYQANAMTSVTLPSTVTEIGANAFNNTGLTEMVIPETVTTLGEGAFASNYTLKSVTLPSGLVTIPNNCFHYCYELSEIVWPEALTSIGDKAFNNCSLSDLVVPEGVTYIGAYAFSSNSNLTKLTLPSTLAVLADYAMASCWSITDFVFTGSAPTIPENTFYYAQSNAWYPAGNSTWTDEVLQNYGGTITWKAMCTEHTYGDWTTVEATCTTGEYQTRTCSVCGWVENTEQGEPLGHDYVETVIEPDCATYTYGKTEITCTRCDYYESKNWVSPEHTYETSTQEPTCTKDGYTLHTCTVCGAYYTDNVVPAYGHTVENWSEPTEATCTEPGVKTGTCSVCNETATEEVTPALGHEYTSVVTEPTCTEGGYTTHTCSRCSDSYTDTETDALGHTVENWSESTEATCTEPGVKTGTCSVCGETATEEIPALGHTEETIPAVPATCTETGLTEGKKCSVCNEILVVQEEVPALGHEYTAVVTDPTCTEGGYTTHTCSRCSDSYTDTETEALGHAYESVVTEPTCTEGGYTTHTCSRCSDSYTDTETDALGHAWKGNGCENCDATRTSPFEDVTDPKAFYYDPVLWAVEKGITTGKTATRFDPKGTCTRAQVVTFLWRAAGSPAPSSSVSQFEDVTDPKASYYNAVLWAVEKGITTGKTDTRFDPNGTCTRAQVVTFLWRASGSPAPTSSVSQFEDVTDPKSFYYDAVLWAVENGVTTGKTDTRFDPDGTCTRGQVVTFLYRFYA